MSDFSEESKITKLDKTNLSDICRLIDDTWVPPVYKLKMQGADEVGYRFQGGKSSYIASGTPQGWVVQDLSGNYYHNLSTEESVLSSIEILKRICGQEEYVLDKAILSSDGSTNVKEFISKQGRYQYKTNKIGDLTQGMIITPDGEEIRFRQIGGAVEIQE